MEATLGSNPSYVWRGFWQAKWVLGSGLQRRIGNGETTKVWGDPWVVGTQSRMVLSPRGDADGEMKVAELLNEGTWDVEKVRAIFLPFEQDRILSIPISIRRPDDAWCWALERDGEYSVRSAYKTIMNIGDMPSGESSYMRDTWRWKSIWKSPCLPRIKVFFWQLCKEVLPTKVNINKRIQNGDTLCPICQQENEDELHVVRNCRMAKWVWNEGDWDGVLEGEWRSVRDWIDMAWDRLGGAERIHFMAICWALWEGRNIRVFEEIQRRPSETMQRARDIYNEMNNAIDEMGITGYGVGQTGENVQHQANWAAPPDDFVKINVDAGVIEGRGTGIGVVCRNANGLVEWCSVWQQDEVLEVRCAEALAIRRGLEEARSKGARKVVLESDCLVAIDTLGRQLMGRSNFHLLLEDSLSLCTDFENVVWSFIGRTGNKVAHALAHTSPWMVGNRSWQLDTPPFIAPIVVSEMPLMEI